MPFTAVEASYGKTKQQLLTCRRPRAGDLTNYQLGATYDDFKVAKLWALCTPTTRWAPASRTQEGVERQWLSLGLTAPIGKGNLAASYSTYKWKNGYMTRRASLTMSAMPDGDKFSVGYIYSMSKRTWLYGALGTGRHE